MFGLAVAGESGGSYTEITESALLTATTGDTLTRLVEEEGLTTRRPNRAHRVREWTRQAPQK